MARRTKNDAAKTRLKILKAALDLFSSRGYEKTTVEDIAARIKLTKGAVYWHFSSKADLLRQLVVYVFDETADELKIFNSAPETFDELKSGLKEWMSRIRNIPRNRKHVKMLLVLDWSRPSLRNVKEQLIELDSSVMNISHRVLGMMRDRNEIKEEVDIKNVAFTIGLTWVGVLQCQIGADDNRDYDVDKVFDFMMDSIGKNILV